MEKIRVKEGRVKLGAPLFILLLLGVLLVAVYRFRKSAREGDGVRLQPTHSSAADQQVELRDTSVKRHRMKSVEDRIAELRRLIHASKFAEDWTDAIVRFHHDLLSSRADLNTLLELRKALVDKSNPPALRSCIALILGSLSPVTRDVLADSLGLLDRESEGAVLHGLALATMEPGLSLSQARAFWIGALLYLSPFGILDPGYFRRYVNRKLGLPLDTVGWWDGEMEIPTGPFLKYLGRIKSSKSRLAVVESLKTRPSRGALLLAHQLLPEGNERLVRAAKELFIGRGAESREERKLLVLFASEGRDPIGDLLWMYSVEEDVEVRTMILERVRAKDGRIPVLERTVRLLGSLDLSRDASQRLLELIARTAGREEVGFLRAVLRGSDSFELKRGVIRAIEGHVDDPRTLRDRVELFQDALLDESRAIRFEAVKAIRWLPHEARHSLLAEHLQREPDDEIRRRMLSILGSR